MNKMIKLPLTLFIVAGLSGFLIFFTNKITAPIIEENRYQKVVDMLSAAYEGVETFDSEELDEGTVYTVWADEDKTDLLGRSYELSGTNSFGSITVLVSFDANGNVSNVDIVNFNQTKTIPGEADFLSSLTGTNSETNFDNIDVKNGTTYSSELIRDLVELATELDSVNDYALYYTAVDSDFSAIYAGYASYKAVGVSGGVKFVIYNNSEEVIGHAYELTGTQNYDYGDITTLISFDSTSTIVDVDVLEYGTSWNVSSSFLSSFDGLTSVSQVSGVDLSTGQSSSSRLIISLVEQAFALETGGN